jgi:hypothetical protein
VVVINPCITLSFYSDVKKTVRGELIHHMIKEWNLGRGRALAGAV